MKKRGVIFLMGITAALAMLSGCGGKEEAAFPVQEERESGTEGENDKITLRMTYWNEESNMSALLDYLEEAVPEVKIEFQYIHNDNYNTVVDAQLSAGEGPDIICEAPASALKHAKLGYLHPVNQLGERYSVTGTSAYSYDGNIYALPGISWFEGIYFNRDIFEDNKISLPTTFDEYIQVCRQLMELGIKPLSAGLMSWEPMLKSSFAFVTAEYFSKEEGKYFNSDYREGKVTMNGTLNPYLEKWSELIREGVYTANMLGIDHAHALKEFASGKAAMFCSGPWDYESIMSVNPELNLDMMPFMGTEPSKGWLIGGPGCGFAVNAASPNVELAMKILEEISTVEGQAALWENNQGGSSYLTGAEFGLPESYRSAYDALAAGNVYCPWNEWGDVSPVYETYGRQLRSYLEGQDLEAALEGVDKAAQELLSKSR